MEAFTQSKAVVEAHSGGPFSLMDGHISGEFLECVRPHKIVQKWRLKSWPDGMCITVFEDGRQRCDHMDQGYCREGRMVHVKPPA